MPIGADAGGGEAMTTIHGDGGPGELAGGSIAVAGYGNRGRARALDPTDPGLAPRLRVRRLGPSRRGGD
jgi:ketol-acid reductoisomerase